MKCEIECGNEKYETRDKRQETKIKCMVFKIVVRRVNLCNLGIYGV